MPALLLRSVLPRLGAAAFLSTLPACSGDGIFVPGDGSIARLIAVAGDGQRAIRFINTDGQVAPGSVATDVNGLATAAVTLGGSVGPQVVEARVVDPQGLAVEFELTALQQETPGGGGGGSGGSGGGNGSGGNDGGGAGNGERQWRQRQR
jgi:uncharacterized membrane protein YgcG